MKAIVVNKRKGEDGEYCGRPSPLGNPFPLKRESDRDKVCDQYHEWFYNKIAAQDQTFLNELRRLYRIGRDNGEVRLQCWCAPKRCHCDTIKEFLERF